MEGQRAPAQGGGGGRSGCVAYFDNDFEWPPEGGEAQLAAIPVAAVEAAAGDTACWERFYQQHSRRAEVYKPRRYLPLAFPELMPAAAADSDAGGRPSPPPTATWLLEVGCGLGSSLSAVLDCNPTIRCFACDVSPTALELLRGKLPAQHLERVTPFRCDAATEPEALRAAVGSEAVDLALLVFTLSAVDPGQHMAVLRHVRSVMRAPGALLLFRDYGLYDTTQLRSRRRMGEHLFARQDGTLAFFFTKEYFGALLAECGGWEVVENKYACVRNVNRATGQMMQRVFLHAKARVAAMATPSSSPPPPSSSSPDLPRGGQDG